jgi:DNA-binding GntR family transcriptional regulator
MVPPARSFLNGSTGAAPSRTEAVLDAIKHAILAGELRPGQGLVETELAQMLGVSKTPVREALKTLAGAGLVTMSPYRGATVRAIDAGSAAAIYDLRLLLEPEGVRRAVQAGLEQAGLEQAGPEQAGPDQAGPDQAGPGGRAGLAAGPWAAAQAALAASDAAADQAQRSLANREFHRALYLACGNPLLVKTLDDLRDQTALVSVLSWEQGASWQQEAAEHRVILAAARSGAAGEAAALLHAHIAGFAGRHFPEPERATPAPATEWSTDAD